MHSWFVRMTNYDSFCFIMNFLMGASILHRSIGSMCRKGSAGKETPNIGVGVGITILAQLPWIRCCPPPTHTQHTHTNTCLLLIRIRRALVEYICQVMVATLCLGGLHGQPIISILTPDCMSTSTSVCKLLTSASCRSPLLVAWFCFLFYSLLAVLCFSRASNRDSVERLTEMIMASNA